MPRRAPGSARRIRAICAPRATAMKNIIAIGRGRWQCMRCQREAPRWARRAQLRHARRCCRLFRAACFSSGRARDFAQDIIREASPFRQCLRRRRDAKPLASGFIGSPRKYADGAAISRLRPQVKPMMPGWACRQPNSSMTRFTTGHEAGRLLLDTAAMIFATFRYARCWHIR